MKIKLVTFALCMCAAFSAIALGKQDTMMKRDNSMMKKDTMMKKDNTLMKKHVMAKRPHSKRRHHKSKSHQMSHKKMT